MVIGLGHPLRGDDAAGLEVAALLQSQKPKGVQVLRATDPFRLLAWWEGAEMVIVCDAVCSGAAVGTLHRLDIETTPLPSTWRSVSSHGISLADVITLAQQLGRMPRRLILYGIEGACFDPGAPLSPAVAEVLPQAAQAILQELPHA